MTGVVYFAEAPDGSIKIGTTRNLKVRASNLGGGLPGGCKVLCSVPGDRALEAHFHEALAADRISGEWFRASEAVRATIDLIKTAGVGAIPAGFKPVEREAFRTLAEERQRACDEMKVFVRACAEPAEIGDSIKAQITRAARRIGMAPGRVEDYWRGEVRVIPVEEYRLILRTAAAHMTQPDTARRVFDRIAGDTEQLVIAAEGYRVRVAQARKALGARDSSVD